MQDDQIISLYFSRDERAIAETEAAFGALCLSIAENILDDPGDAEECVNDTWLKAWNSIPPASPSSLKAFLCRITRNNAIDRIRASRRAKRSRDLTVSLSELEDCIPLPDEQADVLPALLDDFFGTLDPLDRRLFLGKYWHGYTLKTLAAGYGLTVGAVGMRLARTRDALRSYLTERNYQL